MRPLVCETCMCLEQHCDCLEEKPSVWTKTPPTETGWYWAWVAPESSCPVVVEVWRFNSKTGLMVTLPHVFNPRVLKYVTWWGPKIEPPEEKP